jgi:hypothetical protein
MLTIAHPLLRRLHDYWSGKCSGGELPSRGSIDPLDLRFIIGNLMLIDVLPPADAPRFRIRLHGTNLAERAGYELTGKMLDELPIPDFRKLAQESFTTVVRSRRPFHSDRDRLIGGVPHRYQTLMLPLFDDARRVNMLLIGLVYP